MNEICEGGRGDGMCRPEKFALRPVGRQGVSILEQVAVVHRAGILAHTDCLLMGLAFGGALW